MKALIGILSTLIGSGLSMEKRLLNIALAAVVVAGAQITSNLVLGLPPLHIFDPWFPTALFIACLYMANVRDLRIKAEKDSDSGETPS